MKKTIKFLSMAALALVGAMTAGCSSDDNIISQPQQPENKNNVVTLTTTVGLDGGATTRALTSGGVKTFAVGDQIAVVYENTSNTMVKAESVALTEGNITAEGKSATFTVTLTDPKASGTVKYIYPAAMAGETDVDYTNLNAQDGTLATIASNLDLAVYEGNLTSDVKLPASASLENKLAIIAYTIKDNAATPNDLTSTITGMTISDGTNNYTISGKDADGHIYAAIRPVSGADIEYTATNGTKNYAKSVTGKTYAAGQFYQLGLRMTAAPVADLLDVQFQSGGSAVDVSSKQKTVTLCGSTSSVYYSETYQRYVASFSHTWGATATGYYKVDFENDEAFRNALANGHSLEVLCMANYDGEIPNSEAKPFSAMQAGGTGFLVTTKKDDRQNELCFLPNTSTNGTSTWRWTNCGIVPQKGVFYHIVGVWDKTNSKSYIYVNGELKKEQDAPGNLNFAQTGCNWFCIGGDPNDASTANGAWQGDVAIARVYDKPLTADEAKALWLIDGTGTPFVYPIPAPAPTLSETLTTAGKTVKVNFNYYDEENYCQFLSNGDGTYTFDSGEGYVGGDDDCAKALVVEGGKLVFKQSFFETIDFNWGTHGFSVTFDTSNNTYSEWRGETAEAKYSPSFISVEVNGTTIDVKRQ